MKPRAAPASYTDIALLSHGVRKGERAVLARAITLAESKRADHQHAARELVQDLLPHTGHAVRVGITGAPGVGKSTSIDTLGAYLTAAGHKVAVLAVDPSSATRRAWPGSPSMPTLSSALRPRPERSAASRRRRAKPC